MFYKIDMFYLKNTLINEVINLIMMNILVDASLF